MPSSELASTLEHRSGLLGLSGTADMRTVLEAEGRGDPDAALAIGVYLHRFRAGIAAMVAALGGLDVLVFTGGVGEHSAPVRWRAAAFTSVRRAWSLRASAHETSRPAAEGRSFGTAGSYK